MFYDDIKLVEEMVGKYGLKLPFVDLGGHEHPWTVDYVNDRFWQLERRPFDHLAPGYDIFNPDKGDPTIEELPQRDYYGTATCLSVLEHAIDPLAVFNGIRRLLQPGGLAIVSTVFEYRYHGAPDYWRFSPDGLITLADRSQFKIIECDWRLNVARGRTMGGDYQPVKTVYIAMRKGISV